MYPGVRLFIGAIFGVTGLAFLATTGSLIWEFRQLDWFGLASFYSHLFVFFPTLGLVALAGFFLPACVFVDLYWRHVPYGRIRFIFGFLVVVAAAIGLAMHMRQGAERSIYEIAPATLAADKGVDCGAGGHCKRLPVLKAVENVRSVSQKRMGLSDLARNCETDPLKEDPAERLKTRRFCFATTPYSENASRITDAECCVAQKGMLDAINRMYVTPGQRSTTGLLQDYLLGFNVFFLLMVLTIGIMLAARRKQLERYYPNYLHGIERGMLVGAAAMIIYPVMVQAFLQSASLIIGSETPGGFRSFANLITWGFGAFGLLLLFFFYRRRDKEMQSLARIGGIVGSGIAIVKYEQIIDVFVRVFGSGAGWINLVLLIAVALGGIILLFLKTTREIEGMVPVDEETLTELALGVIDGQMPR